MTELSGSLKGSGTNREPASSPVVPVSLYLAAGLLIGGFSIGAGGSVSLAVGWLSFVVLSAFAIFGLLRKQERTRIALENALRVVTETQAVAEPVEESSASGVAPGELEAILRSAPDCILLVEPDGRLGYANPAARSLAGLAQDDFAATVTLSALMPASAIEDLHRRVLPQAGRIGNWQGESELRGVDGLARPVSLAVICHEKSEAGYRYSLICRDIQHQKRFERALRESEESYRNIVRTATEGVLIFDAAGTISLVNPAFTNMLGYRPEEVLGRSLPNFVGCYRETLTRLARNRPRGPWEPVEWRLRRKNGGDCWVLISSAPLLDADGGYRGGLAMLTDITEHKLAESRLHESQRELRRLSAFLESVREGEQRRLSRELHDELGQLLTALKLDCDWLRGHLDSPIDDRRQKTFRMGRTIDDTVAAVRRLAADLRPQVLDDLGLAAACEWLVDSFRERTNLVVELHMEEEDLELSDAVATALFRVLQEALTNIARHAQANEVHVELVERGDDVRLRVEDDGVGLPADPGNRDGFGLIGMRERVYILGGELEIANRRGGGTVVNARIPTTGEEDES